MRYRPEHKEETHKRIVETASREFREKGFEGVGIANLMKKLDLTHGGFYAHFENKDDLVQEAMSTAFDEVDDFIEDSMKDGGIAGLIELYLSQGHIDNPGMGCPVPPFASEVKRQHPSTAALFTERLRLRFDMFVDQVPGKTAGERLELATFIFSSMVGTVSIARAIADPVESKRVLDATRKRLLELVKP